MIIMSMSCIFRLSFIATPDEIDAENAECSNVTLSHPTKTTSVSQREIIEKLPGGEPISTLRKNGLDPDLMFTLKKIMKFDFDYYNFYETFAINQDF